MVEHDCIPSCVENRGKPRRIFASAFALAVAVAIVPRASAQSVPPAATVSPGRILLVTPAEVLQYKSDFFETLVIPLAGDEPVIEILRPRIVDGVVPSPVPIEVRFKAVEGAKIDPASFKVFYGMFKLDVTERLFKTVTVTPQGFKLEQVDVPAGSHRLIMRIADDKGRLGVKEIKFTVEG